MALPIVHYFPICGRAEPARLILASLGLEWTEGKTDWATMKADTKTFPHGQAPVLVDGDALATQSNAMVRHLARKHALYGDGLPAAAAVDSLLDAIETVKAKYLALIYQDACSEEAKATYYKQHVDPAAVGGPGGESNGGAHFAYLERMLAAAPGAGGGPFFLGAKPSAADFVLYDLADCHARVFPGALALHPRVAAAHAAVGALPAVAAYMASERRHAKINNNGLGQ